MQGFATTSRLPTLQPYAVDYRFWKSSTALQNVQLQVKLLPRMQKSPFKKIMDATRPPKRCARLCRTGIYRLSVRTVGMYAFRFKYLTQKGCGTIDNMIMMRAVIDNNRLNRKTYCYFADAYKCFDKLWLKDCLVELWRAGMREREVYMLYEMNKESHIVIETPVGMTDSITVHEIVKQGTIFGPKLCSVATEKINGIGEEISTHITPELTIGAPVYVDDILGIGDCKTVEKLIRNSRRLEDKKFRFSRKKIKYMVIKSGKGKIEEIKEPVKEGIIERIDEYKYLGWWFSEASNIRRQIQGIKSRSGYIGREIKIMGDKTRVGRHDGRIQKMLYEKVVLPTITYNMESTTNKEMEDMEMIQGKMLRKIYKVPPSTPYWGLLIELGMRPIEYIIHSKRLMLYHSIINTKTKRLCKDIIEQQMIYQIKGGFYEEKQKSKVFFEIGIESKTIEEMKKSTWKAIIKEE